MEKITNFFSKINSYLDNNNLSNMLKNNSIGFSFKKWIGLMITVVFLYLQIAHWSDGNGIAFLTIDAGLITSIVITQAVQNGKNGKDGSGGVPDENGPQIL